MISKTLVFIYLPGEVEAVPAGTLTLTQIGRDLSSTFTYGSRYMQRPKALEIDPLSLPFRAVPRTPGEQIVPRNNLSLFGAIRDATPDSWGRRVIEKQFKASELPEIDYIKHSFDDRVGALDFRDTPTSPPRKHPFNRVIDLHYLLDCADRIDRDEPVPDNMLQIFHYGSSMGGARPKAVVEDESGLWLAKFKSRNDRFDSAKVELATLRLAAACGIEVPEARIENAAGSTIFLIRRFDREKTDSGYTRKHFVSALTLLGKDETESPASSYAEIAEAIAKYGSARGNARMKAELFRRMVFNILVGNNDDHLRNHGFLFDAGAYRLSPAYDIVPSPTLATERFQHLAVGEQGRLSTLDNALSRPGVFGLTRADARYIVDGMLAVVSNWPEFYASNGVTAKDIEALQRAFRSPPSEFQRYPGPPA
jgi:serine/threonine-protein kinase HipA